MRTIKDFSISFRTETTRSETSDSTKSALYGESIGESAGQSHYFKSSIKNDFEYSNSGNSYNSSFMDYSQGSQSKSTISSLEFDLSNISAASSVTIDPILIQDINTYNRAEIDSADTSTASSLTIGSDFSNENEFFALPSDRSETTATTYAGASSDSNSEKSEIDSNMYVKLLTPELNEDFCRTKDINSKEAIHEKLFNQMLRKNDDSLKNRTFVKLIEEGGEIGRSRG